MFFLWVFTGFFSFFGKIQNILWEKGSFSLFFLFRRRVMFLTKKILANQVCLHYYNTIHCSPFEFRKLIYSFFSKYYHELKKATGTIQKTYFLKKVILSDQEGWKLSHFFSQIWRSVVLYSQSLNYSLSFTQHGRKMTLQQFLFLEKCFFQEKEKISAFLANSTSVIQRNESQKTFGEGPRSVCIFIQAFDVTDTGISYACKCEKFFNANEM